MMDALPLWCLAAALMTHQALAHPPPPPGVLLEAQGGIVDGARSYTEFARQMLSHVPILGLIASDSERFYQYLSMSWMLMLPTLIALLGHFQMQIREWLRKKVAQLRHEHVRDIVFTESTDYYFNLRRTDKNNVLQKAIFLFLGRQRLQKYIDGEYRLMQNDDRKESWDSQMGSVSSRSAAELKKFSVNTLPPADEWTEIEPGLHMLHTQENVDGAIGEVRTRHTMSFRCCARKGDELIQAFITKCYEEYIKRLKEEEDRSRYLYQMQLGVKPAGGDDEGSGGSLPPVFKKYKLSDDKTFDSLFFPEKRDILALVDDFQNSKGKFAIEGFPKKLGLLLYGPPGTGKTTLVKALAAHTNRHIVAVPLGKITTNQQLYDIMFERVFPCLGDDGVAQQLAFDEVIFLMEEVDAATDIVKTRKTGEKLKTTIAAQQSRVFEEHCGDDDDDNKVEDGGNGIDRTSDNGEGMMMGQAASFSAAAGDGFDLLTDVAGPSIKLDKTFFETADKLDLAGLLNILDGVVDSPGRIVIMTTNHPEKLDAALIRPGRINRQLYLGYMDEPRMVEMLAHHYGGTALTDGQLGALRSALRVKASDFGGTFNITPAEVEQLCAENDTFDEFIEGLVKFGDITETFDFRDY